MSNVDVFTIGLDQIHDLQKHGLILPFTDEVLWDSWLIVDSWASFGKGCGYVDTFTCLGVKHAFDLVLNLQDFNMDMINRGVSGHGRHYEIWHVVDDSDVEWYLTTDDEYEDEGVTSPVYQRYELESYLGEYVDEYDVYAIEREVTKYDPIRGCLVWTVFGDDLSDVCARHELPCPPPDDLDLEPVDWFGEMGDTLDELDEGLQQCREAYEYVRALDEIF